MRQGKWVPYILQSDQIKKSVGCFKLTHEMLTTFRRSPPRKARILPKTLFGSQKYRGRPLRHGVGINCDTERRFIPPATGQCNYRDSCQLSDKFNENWQRFKNPMGANSWLSKSFCVRNAALSPRTNGRFRWPARWRMDLEILTRDSCHGKAPSLLKGNRFAARPEYCDGTRF